MGPLPAAQTKRDYMSPTQRTLKELRERGLCPCIVERFLANGRVGFGRRSDMFDIIDIVAISPEQGIVGVQSCGTAFAEHYRKITQEKKENTRLWLNSGGKLWLIGWRKVKQKRGGKRMVTMPRFANITLEDLA